MPEPSIPDMQAQMGVRMDDVPARYSRWFLRDYSYLTLEAKKEIAAWIHNDVWCLYLWGVTDARKTSLAAAILRAARVRIPYGGGVLGFLDAETWATHLRDIRAQHYNTKIESWKALPLLLFDDLGNCRDTPHLKEMTIHLLAARHKREMKTIVTANANLKGVETMFDPALSRRLGDGLVLEIQLPAEQGPVIEEYKKRKG